VGALKSRIAAVIALALLLLVSGNGESSHVVPYRNYGYNFWGEARPAPQAYLLAREVDTSNLGAGKLNNPQDMDVCGDSVFVLDTGNHRIIRLDSDWNLVAVIREFDNNGSTDRFLNPRGLFVTDSRIFVADTGNRRIVELDHSGRFIREIGPPVSGVDGIAFDSGQYKPDKVAVDRVGRIFVVAAGEYDGILEFDVDGRFVGYIGAPRVTPSVADYFWRRLATREQLEQMALYVPTEFSNLTTDEKGFLYATVSSSSVQSADMVKRLNPSGTDVLRRQGFFPPMGDVQYPNLWAPVSMAGPSVLVDVAVMKYGIYSVLDRTRGRVFTYDSNGNLLFVFGGRGEQYGTTKNPVALAQLGDKMLILDSATNCISVFEPTDYARAIYGAIASYNAGLYDESARLWNVVLAHNANFDLAYTGIGRALFRKDDFTGAMANFRLGQDRVGYSKALAYYRREVIEEWLGSVGLSAFVVIGLVWFVLRRRRAGSRQRKGDPTGAFTEAHTGDPAGSRTGGSVGVPSGSPAADRTGDLTRGSNAYRTGGLNTGSIAYRTGDFNTGSTADFTGRPTVHPTVEVRRTRTSSTLDALRYSLYVVLHPLDGFWALKHEKRGNLASATILLMLASASCVFLRQYSGFLFNYRDPSGFNVLTEFASILVPFALWSLVNWALTTLMEGKGTLREIYIASAYALTPLVLVNVPLTVLSNVMILEEGAFYTLFLTMSVAYVAVLLFLATMVTHDYDFLKTAFAVLLIVAGIGIVIFIGLLFFDLIDHMVGFVNDVYMELVFRL